MSPSRTLMLATAYASHAKRSGYNLLAEYVSGAELMTRPRTMPRGGVSLLALRIARRVAFTRWYTGGSARLEWRVIRRFRGRLRGVIHSLWADHDLGFLDLAPRHPDVTFCGTFHSPIDTLRESVRCKWRLRKLDRIILMSESQRPFFLHAGVHPDRIHVILHGVDTRYFTPAEHLSDASFFTVLAVGGHRRDFKTLQALCGVSEKNRRIRFRIVAPADWRSHFQGLPNVEFFSNITDEQLLREYRTASCFAHSAEEATANNALLEALACGLPAVAENVGGIPEYLTPSCGELIPPGDVPAFARALETLAGSTEKVMSMRRAARDRAIALDWKMVAQKTAAIY